MEGVCEVRQLDDKRLHWVVEVGGKVKEWDAEIVEQVPDRKISWRSTSGARNSGVVCFRPAAQDHTQISLEMFYEPEGAMEKTGNALGLLSKKVEGDLERFKEFIQKRLTETGAWRGEIRGRDVKRGDKAAKGAAGADPVNSPEYDTSGKSGLS